MSAIPVPNEVFKGIEALRHHLQLEREKAVDDHEPEPQFDWTDHIALGVRLTNSGFAPAAEWAVTHPAAVVNANGSYLPLIDADTGAKAECPHVWVEAVDDPRTEAGKTARRCEVCDLHVHRESHVCEYEELKNADGSRSVKLCKTCGRQAQPAETV